MSTLEDLQKIQDYQEYTYKNPGRESLLEKYRIPIQNFDFEYVSSSKNATELEKMINVLKSGQEGYYPELLRATEDRLRLLKPNSRFLRQRTLVLNKKDLKKDEVDQIANDLQKWVTDVSRCSRELDERKCNKVSSDIGIRRFEHEPEPLNLVKKKNDQKISSTDYTAWDKYDPDTEIMKIDLEEEKIRREAAKAKETAEKIKKDAEKFIYSNTNVTPAQESSNHKQQPSKKSAKSVSFNQYATEAEALFISERELEKGREFYKNGDYELALQSFSRSIAGKANVTNLNNRALTFIKLKRYSDALNDAERVLSIDRNNAKAHLRRAQAFEGLKNYEEALNSVEFVIEKEPNNAVAQELADRVRRYCRNVLKNTRIKIVEIE
ncbi:sperm-associated antigen 1 [Sitophilus oryzae]|uniref:Sperm-associated antigen 1 n=1 Tax=Sitophilus oryzae TaxID=7048 RepID=A0A6J2YC62_SITOR|nr:sperm-associated antigen 1 [Sitophilus oryzae]